MLHAMDVEIALLSQERSMKLVILIGFRIQGRRPLHSIVMQQGPTRGKFMRNRVASWQIWNGT